MSRPRDRLGRPLSPGERPDPGVPPVPDVTGWTDARVWTAGARFVDAGLPFHAHEVFEQRWRTCSAADRDAWRALAQWGAALTHAARGNPVGAGRLAARAVACLDAAAHVPDCVDVPRVRTSCGAQGGQR